MALKSAERVKENLFFVVVKLVIDYNTLKYVDRVRCCNLPILSHNVFFGLLEFLYLSTFYWYNMKFLQSSEYNHLSIKSKPSYVLRYQVKVESGILVVNRGQT